MNESDHGDELDQPFASTGVKRHKSYVREKPEKKKKLRRGALTPEPKDDEECADGDPEAVTP